MRAISPNCSNSGAMVVEATAASPTSRDIFLFPGRPMSEQRQGGSEIPMQIISAQNSPTAGSPTGSGGFPLPRSSNEVNYNDDNRPNTVPHGVAADNNPLSSRRPNVSLPQSTLTTQYNKSTLKKCLCYSAIAVTTVVLVGAVITLSIIYGLDFNLKNKKY